jgi:hypothetical protein
MVIALVWNNAKSFKQHLDQMRTFRQSHHGDLEGRFTQIESMPTSYDVQPPQQTGGASGFIGVRGKSVVVPIWEIELPSNSQN